MGYLVKQSSTAQPLVFLLVQSSDHITGLTGASPTVHLSKNGAAGGSPAGSVTEIDSTNLPGWYKVAGNATDTATLGPLLLHATAGSADPCDDRYDVVAFDPQAADLAADVQTIKTEAITCAAPVTILASVGTAATSTAQTGDAYARIGAAGASLTAVALTATGLDAIAITDPGGVAGQTTFPKILVALYRRFFFKATVTSTQLKTYANDGTSVNTTQTLSDDSTTQTQGAAT